MRALKVGFVWRDERKHLHVKTGFALHALCCCDPEYHRLLAYPQLIIALICRRERKPIHVETGPALRALCSRDSDELSVSFALVEPKGNISMLKLALRYARYAVVTLTSIGFMLSMN